MLTGEERIVNKTKKNIFNRDATPMLTHFIATGYNAAEQAQ